MIKKYKFAFTLAETLMTLTIIGVIAVITLPGLNKNINSDVLEKQKLVFDKNFNTALSVMQLRGELGKHYASTEEFVQKLSNFIRITHTCKADKLGSCFADKIMQNNSHVKYDISTFSSGTTSEDIDVHYKEPSDIMGIVFADGTNAIITYKKNCLISDRYSNTADLTACLAMYYDLNGKDSPNVIGQDIITLNIGNVAKFDGEIEVFTPHCLTGAEFDEAVTNGELPSTIAKNGNDCWGGAMVECARKGQVLPTRMQLKSIGEQLYGQKIFMDKTDVNGFADTDLQNKLGLSGSADVVFWTKENVNNEYSYYYHFGSTCTYSTSTYDLCNNSVRIARSSKTLKAFCVNE